MDNFNSFKYYMDKIKADTELKGNTARYVREALAERMHRESGRDPEEILQNLISKKALIIACSCAAFVLMTISGYAFYFTPINYISLDINPSVELGINAFDMVVSVKGINDDGKNLIKGKDLTLMSVNKSVKEIIAAAVEQNYISDDGSTVIAVTTESDNQKDIAVLHHNCVKGINSVLDRSSMDAIIYKDSADTDIRDEAESLNISPGKLNLINYLQKLDHSVTVDQYRNSYVTEIISDANELLTDNDTSNDQLVTLDGTTSEILQAGQQLQQIQNDSLEDNETNRADQPDPSAENSDDHESDRTNDSSIQNSEESTGTNDAPAQSSEQ